MNMHQQHMCLGIEAVTLVHAASSGHVISNMCKLTCSASATALSVTPGIQSCMAWKIIIDTHLALSVASCLQMQMGAAWRSITLCQCLSSDAPHQRLQQAWDGLDPVEIHAMHTMW